MRPTALTISSRFPRQTKFKPNFISVKKWKNPSYNLRLLSFFFPCLRRLLATQTVPTPNQMTRVTMNKTLLICSSMAAVNPN